MAQGACMTKRAKCCILVVIALMALLMLLRIPPDMDMFLPFHALACQEFPLSSLHSFREPCNGRYDLTLGPLRWMRSFAYIGQSYSLLYWPLYQLWPAWPSVFAFNAGWMALALFAFWRLSRVNVWIMLAVFGINVFWLHDHLYDMGPIGMQTALLFVIALILRTLPGDISRLRALGLSLFMGEMLFIAMDTKPIFLYYAPVIVILLYAFAGEKLERKRILRMAWRALPGLLLFALLYGSLLLSSLSSGMPYWKLLLERAHLWDELGSSHSEHLQLLVTQYLLNFRNSAAMTYGTQDYSLLHSPIQWTGTLLTLPFWGLFAGLAYAFQRHAQRAEKKRVALLLTSALLLMLLLASSFAVRKSFHLAPVMTLVLAAMALMADALQRRGVLSLKLFLAPLMLSQLALVASIVIEEPRPECDWDRLRAIEAARAMAKDAIIVNTDWGTYSLSSLYGPREQLVTYYPDIRNFKRLAPLLQLADQTKRSLVFIKRTRDSRMSLDFIRSKAPSALEGPLYPPPGEASTWEVWRYQRPQTPGVLP